MNQVSFYFPYLDPKDERLILIARPLSGVDVLDTSDYLGATGNAISLIAYVHPSVGEGRNGQAAR